jgi:Dyp-type peroxidase family
MGELGKQTLSEPVLPMTDIQGIVVPGFLKPHQTLLGIAAGNTTSAAADLKKFISDFSALVSTAKEALEDRRGHRSKVLARKTEAARKPLIGIGFTYRGLTKTTPGAASLPSDAFQQGLATRSAYLGDPVEPGNEGTPAKWKVGGPENELDALIVVAGDTRPVVDTRTAEISTMIEKSGMKIVYRENGDVRDDLPGHEQFGFDDGISQPGIRGRASEEIGDFVTPRHISENENPAHSLFGYPGQDLVWPGVLVLGHPATGPDPLIPGTPSPAIPTWSHNGSYLVFRRLRQDVGLFWRTMQSEAKRLSALPGFTGMTDEELASRIVGRWPSGAPVNRVPGKDDPQLGDERLANNHFRFDSDAHAFALTPPFVDKFPQSTADPAGIKCPWAAHIRKVNTRDSASDTGGRDSTYIRRLLRIGVAFGKPLKDRYAETKDDPEKGQRGLLFLSIQASIEDQFEFLVARWMGDPSRPKMPGGHDILVGQNDASGEDRERRCVLFGAGVQQATVATNAQWIIPTGGGYFFVPSLTSLRDVIGAHA